MLGSPHARAPQLPPRPAPNRAGLGFGMYISTVMSKSINRPFVHSIHSSCYIASSFFFRVMHKFWFDNQQKEVLSFCWEIISSWECETPENPDFLRKDKMVISVKIRNFSRSRMTKRTSPLESSREI